MIALILILAAALTAANVTLAFDPGHDAERAGAL